MSRRVWIVVSARGPCIFVAILQRVSVHKVDRLAFLKIIISSRYDDHSIKDPVP
jgi:hypothetical protein